MQKKDVIEFFDCCASKWDEEMIRDDRIINRILDNAGVCEGKEILDVACGTGVLIPDYLARNVKSITAIDISPEMVRIAKEKFKQEHIEIICADIEKIEMEHKFDNIVVYNAFPHFSDSQKLIEILARYLKPAGTLTIAHGMSKKQIDNLHRGKARKVSNELMGATELASIFEEFLEVTTIISNDEMYQVVGYCKE